MIAAYGSLFDLICAASELGLNARALFTQFSPQIEVAADGVVWATEAVVADVWRMLQQQADDEAVALRLGERPLARLSLTVVLMHTSGGPLAAIERMAERWPLHYPESRWRLDHVGRRLEVRFESHLDEPLSQWEAEYRLAWLAALVRRITCGQANPTQIAFTAAEPPYRDEFYRVFRCPVVFGQPANVVHYVGLDGFVAALPADPWLEEMTRSTAAVTGVAGQPAADLRARLVALLRSGLAEGGAGIKTVAPTLQLSEAQLRTRLRREGVTYRNLIEDIRKQVCLELLRRTELTIDAVAARLGYANTANFYRACQRWFGMTPTALRERVEQSCGD